MNELTVCPCCAGFVPKMDDCPHCGHAIAAESGSHANAPARSTAGSLVRGAQALALGAVSMTLMACYGATNDPGAFHETLKAACSGAAGLRLKSGQKLTAHHNGYASSNQVGSSCGGKGHKEQMTSFVAPKAGTLTVKWTAEANQVVYVLDGCDPAKELMCDPPGKSGTVTVAMKAKQSVTIVVDGVGSSKVSGYTLNPKFK